MTVLETGKQVIEQGPYERQIEIRFVKAVFGRRELKEYTILEAPLFRSKKWRRHFEERLLPLVTDLLASTEGIDLDDLELHDLLRFKPLAERVLVDAIDDVVDSLLTYSEELEADSEWLGNNATEKQFVEVYWEVLKMALPFDLERAVAGGNGLMETLTSLSSLAPSGGTPISTPASSEEAPSIP